MTSRQRTMSKILEVKEFTKEQLEAEAGKAMERLKREQDVLDALDATYRKSSTDLTEKQMNGNLPMQEIELYYAYLKHLAKQMDQQRGIIAIRNAELEKARAALVGAHREHRLIEILHGKLEKECAREASQMEQQTADYSFLSRKAER